MVETELKFQVPAAARAGVLRAVATATAQRTRLRAAYADTPDHRLAGAGLALRLRQEGTAWVQTLKGRGDGLMQRLEHEVALPAKRGVPVLDPARHAGTPAGEALAAALGHAELHVLYRTDIQRVHRCVRSGGASIEIAFDSGRISAGRRSAAVCEIEFELLAGPPAALLALAARWVQRHGLWLDVRTKSERGFRLAQGLLAVPATRAGPARVRVQASAAEGFAATLHSTLAHVLPNAAELASDEGAPEHLHQLRVGLRRLRTALRLFGPWGSSAEEAAALEAAWREPFGRLGAARDGDVLAAGLLPALAAAGAPWVAPPAPAAHEAPGSVVRAPAFTLLALRTLQLTLQPAPDEAPALRAAAGAVLQRAWRQVARDAAGFASAPVEAQHRTRRRLKRLRYASEFMAPLFAGKALKTALRQMRQALNALGAYNDVVVAEETFRAALAHDARAWFALGWLAAQHHKLAQRAAAALARVAEAPRFWR